MFKSNIIYLDHASNALVSSANPGAIHELGVKEKNKLKNARTIVANILNAQNNEIVFTSGATESNNLAILGLVHLTPRLGLPHIITTNIEHASVLEVCKYLEKTKQVKVTYVEVEKSGIVDPKKIKKALTKNTILVSVMYANNEIGTIQPIKEIAKEIRHFNKINSKKIFFHTDATQAVNYLSMNIAQLGVDLLSFNSAKIYGPKGVGVLYIKKNTPIRKIMFGGEQERGLRPGTENVTGILEFAHALQITEKIKNKEVKRLTQLRDYFFKKLREISFFSGPRFSSPKNSGSSARPFKKGNFPQFLINGDLKERLPNNVNITIPKIPSDLLVIELSARGIMASAKSACKSGDGKDSHVILALREKDGLLAKDLASAGSLRFSLGRDTTKKNIDYTIKFLFQILQKLKRWYN